MKMMSLMGCGMLLFASCSQDVLDDSVTPNGGRNLNEYVYGLPSVKQMTPFKERLALPGAEPSYYKPLPKTRAKSAVGEEYEQAREVEEMLLFTEDQEVFCPGALLKSKEWVTGTYLPIEVDRKPITLSTTLLGNEGSVVTIDKPTLSSVRAGISKLLTKEYDAPAANITYSSEEVYDEEHLKIALGINYNGVGNSFKGNGLFEYKNDRNRYLVKIQQVFYTIDVDRPRTPADFIAVPANEYEQQLGKEKPIYVSSIKMGRVFLLGVETSLTKTDAEAKIQASFLSGGVGVEAETAFNELKKNSKITARVLGGDAQLSARAITDIKQVATLLSEGAKFSRQNPGAPIAYKLRELGTNKPFKTVIYSKYHKSGQSRSRFKDYQLDFKLVFTPYSLFTPESTLSEVGVSTLRIYRKGSTMPNDYNVTFGLGGVSELVSNLEVGDRVQLIFDRTAKKDRFNKVYVFDLPEVERLMELCMANKGETLYGEKNPLKLKSSNNNGELTLSLFLLHPNLQRK